MFATELEPARSGPARLVLEALHLACSAGAWEVLRRERGLSVDDAEHVVGMSLTALLEPPR